MDTFLCFGQHVCCNPTHDRISATAFPSSPSHMKVLDRVGLTYESLVVEGASLSHWVEAEVHRLVATFLQVLA